MACCTRWHAAVYFTMAVILAFIAISMTLRSEANDETSQTKPISHIVSLNASRTLRRAGFNIMATLLQVSPELFFSSANATLFAVKDSAISNATLPPRLLKNLLQYHTSPLQLSMEDLLSKPQGACLPTLYQQKSIAITKVDEKERSVEINNVLVSHPNLFLEGPISIHGVLGPFSALDPRDVYRGWDIIQSPACDSNSNMISDVPPDLKNMVEWTRIIRLLNSNGFVSFAIGLHSVLDGILGDHKGLKSVTIFVPPSLELEAYPTPLLEKIVRFHVLPQKFTNRELESLAPRTLLRTLLHGQPLEVTGAVDFMKGLVISGVNIVAPDMFSSSKFIVHGISRALELDDLPNTAR
ncbi:hypothetical protein PRUPE_3G223600 [Prunus persica]|uniref:Uncharacterized protein n=1 Tax=Prunus persica TaxID=3760 RepID=M5X5K8_PRUPE|nr:fasciclin-like arabinogalactan protein 21 [Prunus persica]ONI18568.1 hypothetical protein PRUPE_3G223600 [Prunus persica]